MSTESKGLFSFFASSGAKGGYPCSIKIHCLFIVTHTLTTTVVCQSIEWARAKGRHGWYGWYYQSKSQSIAVVAASSTGRRVPRHHQMVILKGNKNIALQDCCSEESKREWGPYLRFVDLFTKHKAMVYGLRIATLQYLLRISANCKAYLGFLNYFFFQPSGLKMGSSIFLN